MVINGINRIAPSEGRAPSPIKRTRVQNPKKSDKVQISDEARKKQFIDDLVAKVKKYLERIPDIRQDKVDDASAKIKHGYRLNNEELAEIADQIRNHL